MARQTQTWLPEAGLYYYKARVYSPTLGRFLQTDPIGYGDGLNWYNYVGSDPINKTDPTGLCARCDDAADRRKNKEINAYLREKFGKQKDSVRQAAKAAINNYIGGNIDLAGAKDAISGATGLSLFAARDSSGLYTNNSEIIVSGRRWSTSDFWNHYINGNGEAVHLSDVGLAGVFENHPSVKRAVANLTGRLNKLRAGRDGVFTLDTTTNVRDAIFSVAGSTFYGKLSCQYGLCGYEFYIKDRFEDVFNLFNNIPGNQEYPNGTPFDILHRF